MSHSIAYISSFDNEEDNDIINDILVKDPLPNVWMFLCGSGIETNKAVVGGTKGAIRNASTMAINPTAGKICSSITTGSNSNIEDGDNAKMDDFRICVAVLP